MTATDTIFALATPMGKSGVAVLRMSGPLALSILQRLSGKQHWRAREALLCTLSHPETHVVIDRALALYFAAPASFTGEEVVELHIHGSLGVIRTLLCVLGGMAGLRMAERGEFTRRAYSNGKMDLVEAEGLADLIEAETPAQTMQALRQMKGNISQFYNELRRSVLVALAHFEAYIDFPDEDIPDSVYANLAGEVQGVEHHIANTLADHGRGERVREGVSIVILGAPNAGKSSLMNALTKRDAAIVSHHAGTTRDIIEVHMDMAGYPAILMDTAGIRESADDIESEGIRRALARAEQADIKILIFDGSQWPAKDEATARLMDEDAIIVISKADQLDTLPAEQGTILLSAQTGQGLDALIKAIEARLVERFSMENIMITRARHRHALTEAQGHLARFHLPLPLELKCEELRRAAVCIGQITGKIAVDDVLDVVFREFCIGK